MQKATGLRKERDVEEEDGGRRINLSQQGGDGILGNVTGEF